MRPFTFVLRTVAAVGLAIFAGTVPLVVAGQAASAGARGPFATILFSRTEMTGANNCVANGTGIARLATTVAPYLHHLGLTATGTLTPGVMMQSSEKCVHYGAAMEASWADAQKLAGNFGWTFVSHTATYPSSLAKLTPQQSDAQTCGSANAITAHGLPGANGLIAYPNTSGSPTALHAGYGSKCFAWGRVYGSRGITDASAARTPPYWQHTHAGNGGPCADTTRHCSKITMLHGSTTYTQPSELIGYLNSLTPGQWFTFQSFVLVTGRSDGSTSSGIAWDCTSPDPAEHWTNDNEWYCYRDFQRVIAALVAKGVVVTDPLSVGVAFGRPATYPKSALPSRDTTPPSTPTSFRASADAGGSSVSLTWGRSTDNTGVAGYRVERSTDQARWTVVWDGPGTSCTDRTTTPGTRYYYRVRAYDAAGNDSAFARTSVTTPRRPSR